MQPLRVIFILYEGEEVWRVSANDKKKVSDHCRLELSEEEAKMILRFPSGKVDDATESRPVMTMRIDKDQKIRLCRDRREIKIDIFELIDLQQIIMKHLLSTALLSVA